jgi:hypothetical protein
MRAVPRAVFALSASLVLAVSAGPVFADDSGSFFVMLGQDTVGAEQYTRTKDRLDVRQVGRAPRVLRRHYTYDLKNGEMTHVALVVTPPGSETPTQSIDATMDGDSLRGEIKTGTNPPVKSAVYLGKGTLIVGGASPWAGYESLIPRLMKAKADTLGGRMYYLGAGNTERYLLTKVGKDSVRVANTHEDVYVFRVDKKGRFLGSRAVAGTQKFAISRVEKLDLDAVAASYGAREQSGAGVGVLSPRDSVKVDNAGGATLMIDYGRPAKRGRAVYGGIVPYGEVWRTGANAATQFRTDKPLDFGGTVVPAGFYTLWTLPTAGGWKLIVNSETGQWGTAHKADKDLFTLDMKVSTLPQVVERFTIGVESSSTGGVLNLDWDTTRASIAFTTKSP